MQDSMIRTDSTTGRTRFLCPCGEGTGVKKGQEDFNPELQWNSDNDVITGRRTSELELARHLTTHVR